MNKKLKAGLTMAALLCASGVHAQTTGSTGGTGAGAGTTGSGAVGTTTTTSPVGTGVGTPMGTASGAQQLPSNAGALTTEQQAAQNAQNARTNSAQANPGQTSQQATGGGVFGPSAGPGIFGPASTSLTTDIYGNQLPAGGTVQPSQPTVPVQGARGTNQQRSQNPISYDANGQPLPSSLYPQAELPRDINPILPSGSQQTQPGAGAVTGR